MVDAPRDEHAAAGTPAAPREPGPARSRTGALDSSDVSGPDDFELAHGGGSEHEERELDARHAYQVLEIRTPLEEFEGYVRARVDTLSGSATRSKAELAGQALELGRRALARVAGTSAAPERSAAQRRPRR